MSDDEAAGLADDTLLEEILNDPERRKLWAQRLSSNRGDDPDPSDGRTPANGSGKGNDSAAHPTFSGTREGAWTVPPFQYSTPWGWPCGGFPPFLPPTSSSHGPVRARAGRGTADDDTPGTSWSDTGDIQSVDDADDGQSTLVDNDQVELLDEAEALELVEFDPSIDPKEAWDPPKAISNFLDKHFNRSLSEAEREAIMKDFPKPKSNALSVPRLDCQIKEHLKAKGRDPHFGAEKSLFRIQESLLDIAGPLSCLWSDLLKKDAKPSNQQVLLLTQRALVLVGSANHQISSERRKIAWNKINPKLRSLAEEDYSKRENNLFGPGFLELASKRIEMDKTMSKVSGQPPAKKFRYSNDKSDLRNFLAKGPRIQHGGRRAPKNQPYDQRFRSKKYFQSNSQSSSQASSYQSRKTGGQKEKRDDS